MSELIIIMGVSGCGKSTIGKALAREIGAKFMEGDEFHSQANIDKMRAAVALTDEDRAGWLDAILEAARAAPDKALVLACSALTPYVQQRLMTSTRRLHWIHLAAPASLIQARLEARRGHFMSPELLESQFEALCPPKGAASINAAQPVKACLKEIRGILPAF
jgi:carbohydrate kinase (thermoresistant glucokinase family)